MTDHPDLIALQRFREFRGVPGLREAIDRVSELVRGLEDASKLKDGMLEAQRVKLERIEENVRDSENQIQGEMHEMQYGVQNRENITIVDASKPLPCRSVRHSNGR